MILVGFLIPVSSCISLFRAWVLVSCFFVSCGCGLLGFSWGWCCFWWWVLCFCVDFSVWDGLEWNAVKRDSQRSTLGWGFEE